ncbi:hypothetical protein NEOLEDRAFT_332051 [Neolentinus lepideus HHB14362 ss-1]|uniref:Uncharacterized protein n=1 Tax=Neolentinus lepideus HHB14362 ss-1 TaxID=1314782 RepID=A0A165SU09_9AGAM|nr:hypothetical protein NEOLEDRAFT_332051 [Neolentinus lepideus HHB14362 ss-1]
MTRILVILREESERVSEIKSMHDGRLPPGLLVLGPEVLRNIPLSELLTPSSPSGSMAWIESWLGDSGLHEDNSWLPVPSRPRGVSQSSEMSQVPPPYSPPLPPDESRPVVTSREDSRESLQSPTPSSLLGISRNESGGRWQSVKAKISVIGRLQRSLVKIREASAGRLRWSSTPSVISNGVSSAGTSVS